MSIIQEALKLSTRPLRILFVEDSAAKVEQVRCALLKAESRFDLSVACGREEFELLFAGGHWDVILSDIQAPGYDAMEIVDVVRASGTRQAVVILTDAGSEALAAEAIKRGATDYLVRNEDQLLRLPDMFRACAAQQQENLSVAELHSMLEAAGEGIVVMSNAYRVIHSNALARSLWNIPEAMQHATDFSELQTYIAEKLVDPTAVFERFRQSIQDNSESSETMTLHDGRVFEWHARPQMLAGERIGWVLGFRDITETARANRRLKRSLALQQATLDATADGILVVDGQRQVVGTNRTFQRLWRIPDELLAAGDDVSLIDFVLDQLEDADAFVTLLDSVYARPADVSRDTLRFKDGRVFERYSQPQFMDGQPSGRVWSFRDITAFKEVEAVLRESEARFRLMFEQAADPLMILDGATGKFSDCNQATVEMFGIANRQAIRDVHPADLSPPHQPDSRNSLEKATAMIDLAMRQGSHRFEWRHCTVDGKEFPAEVLLAPMATGQRQLIIATVRDISVRKHEEQTQRALLDISEAAQSSETLDELFPRIHQIVSGLLPARNFFVALYDEKSGEITFPYYEDEFDSDPGVMMVSDGTVTATVIQRGVAMLFTPDSTNEGRLENVPYIGTGSMDWLGVPLKSKSRTVGALVVQSYDGNVRYTENHKSLLEFVSGQVANAIERKQADVDLRDSEARLEEAQRLAHMGNWEWNIQERLLTGSDELWRIFGVDPQTQAQRVSSFLRWAHPDDRRAIMVRMVQAREDCQPFKMETRICRPDGEVRTLQSQIEVRVDRYGRAISMIGASLDISASKLEQLVELERRQVLEQVARNEALPKIVNGVVGMLERQIPGSRCAMQMLRHGRLYSISAPRLPEAYRQALEGTEIGPAVGSCGTACHFNKTVVVQDIATDPLWNDYAELALSHNLRACWSTPISSSNGGILGSLAVYHDHPCAPSGAELDSLVGASQLAAVAIEQRLLTDQLAYQAQHDALTGLPNRLLLQDRLSHALALARRNKKKVAVLFMDLDHFKQINDTLGHSHGDVLLREVARRLEGCIRKSDTLARLGGDEFMMVLPELSDPQDATRVARKVMESLRAALRVGAQEFFVNASLGISIYPADGQDADTLMANADTAMYRAKETGRNKCIWFTPQMNAKMLERIELESHFRRAMAERQLSLHYQPICGPAGEILTFEALLRWEHPTLGRVSPATFIPVAEESGLIVPIGEWVMREACSRAAAWRKSGHRHLSISVNVSAVQFRGGQLLPMVRSVLADTGLAPSALVLEITESLLLQNAAEVSASLVELRKLGVGIAIDDFGTGFSSLSYLHKLPVTILKIDQSFVCEIGATRPNGRNEAPIIRTIIALARNLDLEVVAEGVETQTQYELLKTLGCDGFQGFLLHRPLTADAADKLLAEATVRGA